MKTVRLNTVNYKTDARQRREMIAGMGHKGLSGETATGYHVRRNRYILYFIFLIMMGIGLASLFF